MWKLAVPSAKFWVTDPVAELREGAVEDATAAALERHVAALDGERPRPHHVVLAGAQPLEEARQFGIGVALGRPLSGRK